MKYFSAAIEDSQGRASSLPYSLYQFYKWLVYGPLFVCSTAVGAILVVLLCLVNPRLASRLIARNWARFNAYITPAKVEVHGQQNFDPQASYIVVANHISQFDIFVLYGWLDLDLKWVMKEELRKVPFLGFASAAMGHIYIDRKSPNAAIERLNRAKDDLSAGTSIMIFPEGTRKNSGALGRFKKGAFMMAKNLDMPILPITLVGTDKILPADSIDLFPGKAVMHIHRPIEVGDMDTDELIAQTRSVIESAIGRV